MPRFLCVQRSVPNASAEQSSPTEMDMKAIYAKFGEWQKKFEDNLVDMGGKLGDGRVVTMDKIDGPFVEVKELAGGYMIVQAESLDAAIEVARACPGLVSPRSGVEVIEIRGPG